MQRGIACTVRPVIFTCLKTVLVPERDCQEIEAQICSNGLFHLRFVPESGSGCGTSSLRVVWGIWKLAVTYLREGGKQ